MTFTDLAQWWNLIFVVPFAAAVGLLLLTMTGLIASELSGDLDTDFADADAHDGHWDAFDGVLNFLGLGRAPLAVVLMSFCFIWGLTGVTSNRLIEKLLPNPHVFVWPSMGVALVVGALLTHFVAKVMAKIMPTGESYATTPQQLVGKVATARFRITATSGTAQLYDNYGNLHEVSCRVPPGEPEFAQGEKVVLMEYDEERKVFLAHTDPLHELGIEEPPAVATPPPPRRDKKRKEMEKESN